MKHHTTPSRKTKRQRGRRGQAGCRADDGGRKGICSREFRQGTLRTSRGYLCGLLAQRPPASGSVGPTAPRRYKPADGGTASGFKLEPRAVLKSEASGAMFVRPSTKVKKRTQRARKVDAAERTDVAARPPRPRNRDDAKWCKRGDILSPAAAAHHFQMSVEGHSVLQKSRINLR